MRDAIDNNDLEAVKKILEQGGGVNALYDYDKTALMLAAECMSDCTKVVRYLLSLPGVDVNAKDHKRFGETALMLASSRGFEGVVACLLEKDDIDVNVGDTNGDNALIDASFNGRENIVSLLLDKKGIDINYKGLNDNTVLMLAAKRGWENIVSRLLKMKDIDVNAIDKGSYTALMWAESQGHINIANILRPLTTITLGLKESNIALNHAAKFGHANMLDDLLKVEGIDVNNLNDSLETPLILAAREGHEHIVSRLLKVRDIDVNAKARRDKAALTIAVEKGHEEIVSRLLKVRGINVNCSYNPRLTLLIIASANGSEKIVSHLLKCNSIDVNARDGKGRTALILASRNGYNNIVSLLLKAEDIDLTIKDFNGETALMAAASNDYVDIVNSLMKHTPISLEDSLLLNVCNKNSKNVRKYLLYKGILNTALSPEAKYNASTLFEAFLFSVRRRLNALHKLQLSDDSSGFPYRKKLLLAKMHGVDFPEDITVHHTGMRMLKFGVTAGLMRLAKICKLLFSSKTTDYIAIYLLMLRKNAGSNDRFAFFENISFDIKSYVLEFLVGDEASLVISDIRKYNGESPASSDACLPHVAKKSKVSHSTLVADKASYSQNN